ncbi:putative phage abortive infection protein [Aeromonas hydrophila]|uniref:putative phage abortive infection protein n=1 Tax=Aeromonas hydrophila TaxID=644 RepID=UPI00207C149B|nr:putative phage abortive infection protein [Aeromonas hydrophila]MCO4207951.1 putative phage abortive infection protein [Aeromonas hydrophila]
MSWLKRFSQRFIFVVLCSMPFIVVSLLWWKYPTWIVHEWMFDKLLAGKIFAPSLGEFGDVYGALNTLFSGLAFSGVIISIVLQSIELRATRKEMNSQVLQFEQQTEAMQKQVFESSFFSMMNLHNTISSNLRDGNKFRQLFIELADIAENTYHNKKGLFIHLNSVYDNFMSRSYSDIGHYFRYIYQIIKFIDGSKLAENDKFVYMNILRAQFSNYELVLLFVNCICYKRSEKFKLLVEKYSFFEHIYHSDLQALMVCMNNFKINNENGDKVNPYKIEELIMLYSPQAYGLKPPKN